MPCLNAQASISAPIENLKNAVIPPQLNFPHNQKLTTSQPKKTTNIRQGMPCLYISDWQFPGDEKSFLLS
jgi:hypothetical protein